MASERFVYESWTRVCEGLWEYEISDADTYEVLWRAEVERPPFVFAPNVTSIVNRQWLPPSHQLMSGS